MFLYNTMIVFACLAYSVGKGAHGVFLSHFPDDQVQFYGYIVLRTSYFEELDTMEEYKRRSHSPVGVPGAVVGIIICFCIALATVCSGDFLFPIIGASVCFYLFLTVFYFGFARKRETFSKNEMDILYMLHMSKFNKKKALKMTMSSFSSSARNLLAVGEIDEEETMNPIDFFLKYGRLPRHGTRGALFMEKVVNEKYVKNIAESSGLRLKVRLMCGWLRGGGNPINKVHPASPALAQSSLPPISSANPSPDAPANPSPDASAIPVLPSLRASVPPTMWDTVVSQFSRQQTSNKIAIKNVRFKPHFLASLSVQSVTADEKGLLLFTAFCVRDMRLHLLALWRQCDTFRADPSKNKAEELFKKICDDQNGEGAAKVSEEAKRELEIEIKDNTITSQSFQRVGAELMSLLSESFDRFKLSDLYLEYAIDKNGVETKLSFSQRISQTFYGVKERAHSSLRRISQVFNARPPPARTGAP